MRRALGVLLLLATACTGGSTPAAPETVGSVRWSACAGGLQCATVSVPLDHARPDGARIGIALVRRRATGQRIGSLLVNPGGPGASGIELVRAGVPSLPRVSERYDVVGFDPRGVGESSPVRCDSHLDSLISVDSSPDDPAEVSALGAQAKAFADSCRGAGELLEHMTTEDAARDLELLRQALGDEHLTYLGYSYGTFLGATYLRLFPGKAGRLVLDGVVDPHLSAADFERQQAIGFDEALQGFLDDCRETHCPFDDGSDLGARFDALAAAVDRVPLRADKAGKGRVLTQGSLTIGVATGLYNREQGWPALGEALAAAERGDGSRLQQLADSYAERRPDGSYANALAAQLAVNCTDRRFPASIEAMGRDAAAVAKAAPRIGPTAVWLDAPCVFWPVKPGPDTPYVVPAGVPPVLLVGNTRDPATPYANALALHKDLAGSRLITFDGDGHTAVGTSACVDALVSRYLASGALPDKDQRC